MSPLVPIRWEKSRGFPLTVVILVVITAFTFVLHGQEQPLPGGGAFFTKEGPWGRIQCYYFYLEAPDAVVERSPTPDTQTRWRVPEGELIAFKSLLSNTQLPSEMVISLFGERAVISRAGTVNLFPSAKLLEALLPDERQQIYQKLALLPGNDFHEYPIFFAGADVEAWAKNSGLRPELVEALRRLAYRRGNALAFSDVPLLLSYAGSNSEALFIKKKLTRTRTLLARLEVNAESPMEQLLEYWSTGLNLRRKELEPLFTATAATQGVDYLDLLHVLPALPRKLLYTYPGDEFTTHIRFPDCHWTTLNFFNYSAQNYYLDSHLASSAVLEDFQEIPPPYRFGDVLMFLNSSGNAFHSCVYVADDLVYTKNGANPLVPWTLAELQELRQMYNLDIGKGVIRGFRHKRGRLAGE